MLRCERVCEHFNIYFDNNMKKASKERNSRMYRNNTHKDIMFSSINPIYVSVVPLVAHYAHEVLFVSAQTEFQRIQP